MPATLRGCPRNPISSASFADDLHADRCAAFYMPAGSMSLDEFRRWTRSETFPETGKIAYMAGEIFVDMNPERIISQNSVKVAICGVVANLVRKRNSGNFYMSRTRFVNPLANLSNEPDALFAQWSRFANGDLLKIRTPDGQDFIELEGTVDWILEIVGPSSVTKDKVKLRDLYFKAGVSEYWLVDARFPKVDFQILVRGSFGFKPVGEIRRWQSSQLFGKKFQLRRMKNPIGLVDFRLDMK